ncbi:hypothetical protein DAPPUDRAFT_238495 [Daphnia pulex]|uniref:Uncharacterized protein n=1 Tax=Daphnia pulex TaxID=6669 RepID=E9G6K2_DAPPU|nr:hypothetical protein DAPPUDRAFT_238495 [Daphnia pulex]|eukprot:EFX84949.1 hypothetical protein DAPPUDRAFT_238495 [Daphnia pulex]
MASTQNQKSGTTNPGDIFGSSMSFIPLGVAYRIYRPRVATFERLMGLERAFDCKPEALML